jgi:hypothetical protein
MTASCPKYRDRIVEAVTRRPAAEEATDLDRHLAGCPSCRDYREALLRDDRRLAEFVVALEGRLTDLEGRVIGMITTKEGSVEAAPWGRASPGSRIVGPSRWLRYAASAALAISALLIAWAWLSPALIPVAWADVIARVEGAEGFICEWRAVVRSPHEFRLEGVHYESREFGSRDDVYVEGRLILRNYLVPSTREQYGVDVQGKTYFRLRLAQEEFDHHALDNNARELMKLFRSYPYEELGTMRIHEVDAPGIEIRDPDFLLGAFDSARLRLWVDPKTSWPIRLEADYSTDRGGLREEVVFEEFQWDPALPAAELEPEIPQGYELVLEMDAPGVDEDDAVEALRSYAGLTSGRYPRTLTWGAAATGISMGLPGRPDGAGWGDDSVERFLQIRSAVMFYVSLEKSGSDVAYHGDRVSAADFDEVLLRWNVGNRRYRVVYGDLRRETVDAARLPELERWR